MAAACWKDPPGRHPTAAPRFSGPTDPSLPVPQNAMPVPDKLWLSAEKLDPEGVFLLENGFDAFIYAGKNVAPDTMMALFGEGRQREGGGLDGPKWRSRGPAGCALQARM